MFSNGINSASTWLRRLPGFLGGLLVWISSSVLQAAEPLTIAVSRTPLSAPFYVAETQGFFKEMGLQVELRECLGGHRCMIDLLEGQAAFATSSDMVITNQAVQGKDFYVLATFVTSAEDSQLIVRRSAGIQSPADLTGKRIGYIRGSSSHYFLDTFLLLTGIHPQSATYVELQPEAMAGAMKEGKVDAVSAWQPWAYRILQALPEDGFALKDLKPYTLTFNLLTTPQLVETRSADVVRLVRALVLAEQYIRDEAADARAIVHNYLSLEPEFLEKIWQGYVFNVGLDQSLVLTLENEYFWLRQQGDGALDVGDINFLKYIRTDELARLDADRVKIVK